MPYRLLALCLLVAAVSAPGPARAEDPPPDRRPTVAVLYFDYTGPTEQLSVLRKGLAQMLVTDLGAVSGIRLVERDRVQEILAELELGEAKKLDADTAARVGRLLGARWLVLGGYFDLSGALRVDARVVEVETGRILKSVGVTGTPGDFLGVEQPLAQQLGTILATELPPLPPAAKEDGTRRPRPPKALDTATAVHYGKALDARDRGDKATAKSELKATLEAQPDFALAERDLAALMQ
jgi:TolB-like protein